MKKTLAAVLAAMMALSTATVALATDTDTTGDVDSLGALESVETDVNVIKYGAEKSYELKVGAYIADLGTALYNKQVKIDVTVTEGRSLLAAAPTVKLVKLQDGGENPYRAALKVKVKDTYSTDLDFEDVDFSLRVRVTAIEKCDLLGLKKGDTLSVDAIDFAAYYEEITNYGKDMTITVDEVKSKNVVVEMDGLREKLEEKGTETATFYFGDVAAFTAKISEAQKDLNVAYALPSLDDYYTEYPELDFEAIVFKASPKFLRKGTLTFNAIGEDETVVYEVTADGLVELEIADYDSTYETVTVEGINVLTSYLVASEALEVEAEAEVEEPVVEEENPNTGAC